MEGVVNQSLDFYKDKRVFVTGHTGFKGAWLLTWLHLLGATVKGYALEAEDERSLFSIIESKIPFDHVNGDIRDSKKLKNEMLDFQTDIVFHLDAQS